MACLAFIIYRLYFEVPPPQKQNKRQQLTHIKVGDSLTSFITDKANKRSILFLALSSQCDFCIQEIPFYKKIQSQFPEISMIGLFSDGEAQIQGFLQKKEFKINTRSAIKFSALGISGTPTMILCNPQRVVLNIWEGSIKIEQHHQLLSTLSEIHF